MYSLRVHVKIAYMKNRAMKTKSGNTRRSLFASTVAFIAILALILSIAGCASLPIGNQLVETLEPTPASAPALEVFVLDVGQGDSIFLISPSGKTMLIDAGEASAYDTVKSFLNKHKINQIDVVIATHPHSDHIGSMDKVIQNFQIADFYLPDATHSTRTFERMLDALERKRSINVVQAIASEESFIPWDEGVEVRILSPFAGQDHRNLNDHSVVIRIKFKDTAILLMGDAEKTAEYAMLSRLPLEFFKAQVLKVGHHGSATSTTDLLLNAVLPEIALISVGEGNAYSHPRQETLDILESYGATIYRTDLHGTIHVTLDGKDVSVSTQR